jgi:hypothetical protein
MNFLYDYSIFIDGVALFALVGLALVAAIQNKNAFMTVVAVIVSIWAVLRFFALI